MGRKLTFRDIFTAVAGFLLLAALAIMGRCQRQELVLDLAAAQQQFLTEAPLSETHWLSTRIPQISLVSGSAQG